MSEPKTYAAICKEVDGPLASVTFERDMLQRRVKELEGQVTGLLGDLTRRDERGRPCAHVVLSSAGLPCPHPDCTSLPKGASLLRFSGRPPLPSAWTTDGHVDPGLKASNTVTLCREQLFVGGQAFWAWRIVP